VDEYICKKRIVNYIFLLQRKISACPKTAKVRKKAQKGDFMAEKGARMAPKGVSRRILAPFDAFWRIGKKHSVL
jgi:hypothetical protein